MTLEQDLERIRLQEERLQFDRFDADTAWALGSRLRAAAEDRRAPVAIDIQMHILPLFFTALPGATPDNVDWIRRKRNVVMRFQRSSYAVGLQLRLEKTSLQETQALPERDYATHGGCFPIAIRGTGCVGTITVSGLPQREDHGLIVEALAGFLEQSIEELALGPE